MIRSRFSVGLSTAITPWFIVGIGLAVFSPLPVPNALSSLQNLAGSFGEFAPGIDRLAEISAFPDLARIWFLVMWLLLPIEIAFIMSFKDDLFPRSKSSNRNCMLVFFYLISGLAVGVAVIYFLGPSLAYLNSHSRFFNLTTSRIGLGLHGSILLFLVGFSIAGSLAYLNYIFVLPGKRKIKNVNSE